MTTTVDSPAHAPPAKALRIGLWIAQCLGALAFVMAGVMKVSTPVEQLATKMEWVRHFSPLSVRLICTAELLGGLGLILPSALRISPKLTPLAAAGLALLMLGAAGTHVALHDAAHLAPSLVLGALAAFVAWGRWKGAPIASR